MQIEALEIKNYRLFRDAKLVDLPRLTIAVGANGSGKSTLFDIFSFLKEALNHNVAQAVARRGGFRELISRGASGPIGILLKFRENGGNLATYSLSRAAGWQGDRQARNSSLPTRRPRPALAFR